MFNNAHTNLSQVLASAVAVSGVQTDGFVSDGVMYLVSLAPMGIEAGAPGKKPRSQQRSQSCQ